MTTTTHRTPAEFPSQLIGDIVRFHGATQGQCAAILIGKETVSYAELDRRSNRLANALLAFGLAPQSCIAYLGKESACYYELLFACAKANLVLVPINWRLKPDEVKHILVDSATTVMFVANELAFMVDELRQQAPSLVHCVFLDPQAGQPNYAQSLAAYPDTDPMISVQPDAILAQMYTSGTTGLPKGVRLKHHGFFEIRQSLLDHELQWLDWRPGEISLIGIPGFHIGGLWWAIQGFSAGLTNLVVPVFMPSQVIKTMVEHEVNLICVVPAMINMLIMEVGEQAIAFPALRKIVYGGSPIAETLLQRGIEVFDCEFAQIYGLTETGNTAVCLDPDSHLGPHKRLTAAGRPYPCVQLKIIDSQGETIAPHQIGEVCIKTPAHMRDYWQLPQATQNTLVDGWIHSGDAGFLDEQGYLFICDRIKDTIIVAGENIYPAEVENVITKHPSVNDSAVIGVPDSEWGEKIVALVVASDKLSSNDLLNFLKERIADYKIPSRFYFVDSLPRNPSGKILRRELRDEFWKNSLRKV